FPIDLLQKGNEFDLPFALGCGSVDRARTRIKTGKEVQGSFAGILVFDPDWLARLCSQGRGGARPGLQTGFFVHAQDHFPAPQGGGVVSLRCRACRLFFSSTPRTIPPPPKGRVYKVTISWTWAANAASRGTRGESHRGWGGGFGW